MTDIAESRRRPEEQARIIDLMNMVGSGGNCVLDVGARDGYISKLLTACFASVFALDLCRPNIEHAQVTCVEGNLTSLPFADNQFDTVVCAEVLEHIPPAELTKACSEIIRVSNHDIVIGVPYRQDTRIGRTTCVVCKKKNPPYGHVNRFDESTLKALFSSLDLVRTSYVGKTRSRTTSLAMMLMDCAGNPWGTYNQEEPCIYCGERLRRPHKRMLWQRVLGKCAGGLDCLCQQCVSPQPVWIHVLFQKPLLPTK